ncbi:unnamed protein product [Pedinophyceae sp. YPF-701]|nr:unnamed protein product [Pedinophyceae sp. YPF-701]
MSQGGWQGREGAGNPMGPTRAPWAAGAVQDPVPPPLPQARRPAPFLIKTSPKMPEVMDIAKEGGAAAAGGHAWVPAHRRITDQRQLEAFLKSPEAESYMAFLLLCNEEVKGCALSTNVELSRTCQQLLELLETVESWIAEFPPVQQSMRYGNPAFRDLFDRIAQNAAALLEPLLPEHLRGAAAELAPYLVDSFGNRTRIDYGTGHETNFAALLYCLARLGVVTRPDLRALVLRVFHQYVELMRRIQTTYWLEPAGSHGCWGLDDYQFLPFLFGAAQLLEHPTLSPASIHNDKVLRDHADDFMYLACVRFIKSVKKGHVSETSPMINDISGVPSWTKVNVGMVKMYQAEVMAKFPIMQHFLFGSVLDWRPPDDRAGA